MSWRRSGLVARNLEGRSILVGAGGGRRGLGLEFGGVGFDGS
jgi:hypothetical protein